MRIINRIIAMLAMLAVLFGLTTVSAAGTEPVISTPTYSESSFEAADHVVTTTELKSKTGRRFYLNVQAEPMTRRQIQPGSCEQWPVGTKVWNEVVDPATGKRMFAPYRLKAGDNTICADRNGVTRKKSCGNEVRRWDNPPPKRMRLKGKVEIGDYVKWVAEQTQKVTKSGSALAAVKTETCEARATVDNTVFIYQRYRVVVKSRTMSEAQAEGARQITITARNDQKVKGELETAIYLNIKGQASAWCKTTEPTPEHDECPSIPGNQPEGYVCETQPPPENPTWMQFREFNDLEVNWTDDHCVTVNFPSGSGTISWEAIYGSFATPTMPAKSGEQVCNWYKAPSEVPQPSGGTDTISVMAKDDKFGTTIGPRSTQPFRIDPKVDHPPRAA